MVFILSDRVSSSSVSALRAYRYFTKPWLQRYPVPALLPCYFTRLSTLLSGALLSSAALISTALSVRDPRSMRSSISDQPPVLALLLRLAHLSQAAAPRSPLQGKTRASKAEAEVPKMQFHNKNISKSPTASRWLTGAKCEAF